ncbi:MAG: cation transporter [Alistipes sp.]|nr:cation transporter [Alistipes sp.]
MQTREQKIKHITVIGAVLNVLLSVIKIFVGVIGHSAAMLADGVHSLSDLISDIVVLVFSHISSKNKDRGHAFGHGKYETLATLLVSLILVVVGGKLMSGGIRLIIDVMNGGEIPMPGKIALLAAVVSIVAKELLYQATAKVGREVNSPVVIANAWHHRSDALSSVGALIGIGGAVILGNKWTVLDPIVSCLISLVIIMIAVKMAIPSLAELLEASLPEEIETEIIKTALTVDGVDDIHELKTRRNGISFIIDAHIVVDPNISIVKAHDIATNVEKALIEKYSSETQINIHVEPGKEAE